MKKLLIFIIVAALLITPLELFAQEESMANLQTRRYYKSILDRESEYVSSLQFSNGAIGNTAKTVIDVSGLSLTEVNGVSPEVYTLWDGAKVIPYFASFAVMGVIRASEALQNDAGRQTALDYINWYISHMNTKESDINGVAGTVYDYYIFESPDGRIAEVTLHDAYSAKYPENNPNDYDSTDSYAAVFLEILHEYASVFDKDFLADKKEVVDSLVSVIEATYVSKLSLTGAKPNYMVCYLMDNCEVVCGLNAASKIYADLGFEAESEKCASYASKTAKAITDTMYDESAGCFIAAVFEDGKHAYDTNVTVFYPQGACQLFPVLFGVVKPESEIAKTVYERFKQTFCIKGKAGFDWSAYDLAADTYPWSILLKAVVKMGDFETANDFLSSLYMRFIMADHPSPYYCAEAGHVAECAAYLYTLAEPEPEESAVSHESQSSDESVTQSQPQEEPKKSIVPYIAIGVMALAIGVGIAVVAVYKKKHKNR